MPKHPMDRNLDRLVDLLTEHATVVLSGTKLASQLRTSPSTLWDWVERLRSYGVQIRGWPGSGYQLTRVPDILTVQAVRTQLGAGKLGSQIHHLYSVSSTMDEGARLAAAGAPHGTLILAEEQTAGRGRFDRRWYSERAVGLYFTLVLRPSLPPAVAPVMTLLGGIALAESLAEISGENVDLRWPNDVLINEKKCAGILVEMTAEPERIAYLLVGVGVNVNHSSMPEELRGEATSLFLEAGRPFSRLSVLAAVLRRLERHVQRLEAEGPSFIVSRFAELSSYARGKRVRVTDGTQAMTGVTEGLTPEGILLVRRDDGVMEKVLSGQVRAA